MSRVKKKSTKETNNMFSFNHSSASDFYLCSWQRNQSIIPLLFIRTLVFVGCVSILTTAWVYTSSIIGAGTWFIFLTHWGLIWNTITSGFALVISIRALSKKPIDAGLELPWYIKTYWASYNIAVPLAFYISIFYFTMLTELSEEFPVDPVLDILIHFVNSLLMLSLVIASRHPTRLLHFLWPLSFAIIYLIFTVVFHITGRKSPFGESWIYPMIDWNKPGPTIVAVIFCTIGLFFMHAVVVGITIVREKLTKTFRTTKFFIKKK